MVTIQPFPDRVPTPLDSSTPLQQNRYAPVVVFTSTTFPEFESSCRHKLNTVTEKLHIVMLFAASFAVHVTWVVPTGNIDPEDGEHTTEGFAVQLSVAVGVEKVAAALLENGHVAAAATLIGAGQAVVNTGGVVSTTVTVAWH